MKHLTTLPLVLAAAACADRGANHQPFLDRAPKAAFQSDLAAGQSLARLSAGGVCRERRRTARSHCHGMPSESSPPGRRIGGGYHG